jgi:hypothetical protein
MTQCAEQQDRRHHCGVRHTRQHEKRPGKTQIILYILQPMSWPEPYKETYAHHKGDV